MANSATRIHDEILSIFEQYSSSGKYRYIPEKIEAELSVLIKNLYSQSIPFKQINFNNDPLQNVSWIDCPNEVYISGFDKVFSAYKNVFGKSKSIEECLKYEYARLISSKHHRKFGNPQNDYTEYIASDIYDVMAVSIEAKITFIEERYIDLTGRRLTVRDGNIVDRELLNINDQRTSIDATVSNKELNRTEAVLALIELGVFNKVSKFIKANKKGTVTELAKLACFFHTWSIKGFDSYRKPISDLLIAPYTSNLPKYKEKDRSASFSGDMIKNHSGSKYEKAKKKIDLEIKKLNPDLVKLLRN